MPKTYIGYFDESADDNFIAIPGCISTPVKWSRLVREWSVVLKKYDIP